MSKPAPTRRATLALWSPNLSAPFGSLDEWLGKFDAKLRDASRAGASILIAPELISLSWMGFAPSMPIADEPGWLAREAKRALPALRDLSREHGVALVPGSMPYPAADGRGCVNRAFLITPGGGVHHHDKLELTPSERTVGKWTLERGADVRVYEWNGLRIAVLICLDVQLTRVIARLAGHDVDLLVVPTATNDLAGYHRVFDCAKARAVELQCAVAAVGLIGVSGSESYVGGASVYLPCEPSLGESGVVSSAGPFSAESTQEIFTIVPDVPFHEIRRIRHGAAEARAQPARWTGRHVRFAVEPAR